MWFSKTDLSATSMPRLTYNNSCIKQLDEEIIINYMIILVLEHAIDYRRYGCQYKSWQLFNESIDLWFHLKEGRSNNKLETMLETVNLWDTKHDELI